MKDIAKNLKQPKRSLYLLFVYVIKTANLSLSLFCYTDFKELLEKLDIGKAMKELSEKMVETITDHGHDHGHRRKRAAEPLVLEPETWVSHHHRRRRPPASYHHHQQQHHHHYHHLYYFTTITTTIVIVIIIFSSGSNSSNGIIISHYDMQQQLSNVGDGKRYFNIQVFIKKLHTKPIQIWTSKILFLSSVR